MKAFLENAKKDRILVLIIFLGLIARLIYLITAPSIDMDGIEYMTAARDFAHGQFGRAFNNIRLPAYPFAAAFFHLFIPDIELAGRVTSLCFGIFLIAFCLRFAYLQWGWKYAIWFAALLSLHPYLVRYSSRVLSESLAIMLFTSSILCFYRGWVDKKPTCLVWSGMLLALAYLTRAEYVIYFIPLAVVLFLDKERMVRIPFFLVFPILIAVSFLIYLRLQTGLWIIDKKILYWGGAGTSMDVFTFLVNSISIRSILSHIPETSIHFCEAIYPLFLVLAALGFKRTDRRYTGLMIFLILVHILLRSFISHSTKRYSLEFVPLILVFSVNGVAVVKEFLTRYLHFRAIQIGLFVAFFLALLWNSVFPTSHGRAMEKKAGLLLNAYGPERVVASRLPIIAFYADWKWVNLEEYAKVSTTWDELVTHLRSKGIVYMAVDEKMANQYPVLTKCSISCKPFISVDNKKEWVRIYSITP